MADMTDDELLGYAAIHSQTERALFARGHVERLWQLAGIQPPSGLPAFVPVFADTMNVILAKAKARRLAPLTLLITDFGLIDDATYLGHTARSAFEREMQGRAYGHEAVNSAWQWFKKGFESQR